MSRPMGSSESQKAVFMSWASSKTVRPFNMWCDMTFAALGQTKRRLSKNGRSSHKIQSYFIFWNVAHEISIETGLFWPYGAEQGEH
jgi:hypothetical protein